MLPFPKESKTCNYARLNKFMNDNAGRAAIFRKDSLEFPVYTLYLFEINNLLGQESSDDVTENPPMDNEE